MFIIKRVKGLISLQKVSKKKIVAGMLLLLIISGLVINSFRPNEVRPKVLTTDFPYLERIGNSAWALKNQDPIKQILAKAPEIDLNLKENPDAVAIATSTRNGEIPGDNEEIYRWSVELPSGTKFEFGRQQAEGIEPIVKITEKRGWYVRYLPVPQNQKSNSKNQNFVIPKVKGNVVEWDLSLGITARYTMMNDRVKADYIVSSKEKIKNAKLDFEVEYNSGKITVFDEEYAKEVKKGRGQMSYELMPDGDIGWFDEDNKEVFTFPVPVIQESVIASGTKQSDEKDRHANARDDKGKEWEGKYEMTRRGAGQALLSIVLPSEKVAAATFPLTVDPVAIDLSTFSEATAYANGRKIIRDAWGNLIVLKGEVAGESNDNVWYKSYNSSIWTDAGIDLDPGASFYSQQLSGDIDSSGNVHVVSYTNVIEDVSYSKLSITRDESNAISSIIKSALPLDTSARVFRPSLIIANKGEGAGKEKIAVAWAMNSQSGDGSTRGEVRFMQCDVADNCTVDDNWKNASEEINANGTCSDSATSGDAGRPNAIACKGAADAILAYTSAHTKHHVVLQQMPGQGRRSPTRAVKDVNGTLTDLTNAINNSAATTETLNSLTTTDYVYVGDANVFSKIAVDITNTNTNAQLFTTTQYCSANSDTATTCDTWSTLANYIDNTATATIAWNEDGSMLFDEPTNWVKSVENSGSQAYFVRFRPAGAFDSTVSVDEFYVNDRNSRAVMAVVGVDATDDLGTAYVPWDDIGNAGWENNPASAGAPWRSSSTTIDTLGGNYTTFTNFPLTATTDYINNNAYIAYIEDLATDVMHVKSVSNNKDITVAGNWTDGAFPTVTEAADAVTSLTSDGSDIYMFYILNPGTNNLVWSKCTPTAAGDLKICDNASDWGSETTLVADATLSHPQAVVSKAGGDTIAIDVIYTDTTDTDVLYERHYVDLTDMRVTVAASGDDALYRDCDSGTDDMDIGSVSPAFGRVAADSNCSGSVNAERHHGFRFTSVAVAQGAAISSAYLDVLVTVRTGTGAIDFTIYGDDVDSSAIFSASANCTDPCTSSAVKYRIVNSPTASTVSESIDFTTNRYRLDVTDIVQEIICRGAAATQPCVGNFANAGGNWASGNNMAIMLYSTEGGGSTNSVQIANFDATSELMPTLQINLGRTGKDFSKNSSYQIPTGSGSYTNFDQSFADSEYYAVSADDNAMASVSASMVPNASSSAQPAFMFKVNNDRNDNASKIDATAIVRSSIPATSESIYLQVYRGGSTNDWVTMDTESAAAADTDITLTSASITSNLSDYYFAKMSGEACDSSSTNCWTYWRVYQDPVPSGGVNQVLSVDHASITYSAAGPTQIGFSNSARSFTAGACNGAAQVFTMELQNGSGTPTNPSATTVVRVTSNTTGTLTVYTDSTCSTVATNGDFTFTTSENTKSVYVKDTFPGSWTISGTRQSGDTLTTGTQGYTVINTSKSTIRGGTQIRGGTSL